MSSWPNPDALFLNDDEGNGETHEIVTTADCDGESSDETDSGSGSDDFVGQIPPKPNLAKTLTRLRLASFGGTGTLGRLSSMARTGSLGNKVETGRTVNFAVKNQYSSALPEETGICAMLGSIAAQLVACTAYIAMNANLPIVRALSKPEDAHDFQYSVGSVMIATQLGNIALGLILTKASGGTLASCFDVKPMLKSSHLAIMSAILVVLKFQVLVYLTATLATMFEQLKLVTLAIAARLVFGKTYSSVQIMSLASLLLAMISYAAGSVDAEGSSTNLKDLKMGLLFQVSFVLVSTFSTILREFKFKGGSDGKKPEPFPLQQFRIAVPGLMVALIFYTFIDGAITWKKFWVVQDWKDMFHGWDRSVLVVIIVMLAVDWLGNYIQKILDSVVVQVLGCVTIPVVYVENIILRPAGLATGLSQWLSLAMVVLIASSFAISTRYTNRYLAAVKELEEMMAESNALNT